MIIVETRRKIPKNITFEPLSDLALKHFRELLTRDYRYNKTLYFLLCIYFILELQSMIS